MIYDLKQFVQEKWNTEKYEIVSEFAMLYAGRGWECDKSVVLIRVEGKHYAIGSSRGITCLLDKSYLLYKAEEYSNILSATLKAAQKVD